MFDKYFGFLGAAGIATTVSSRPQEKKNEPTAPQNSKKLQTISVFIA
jgi:hypothetical protein